MKIKQDEIRYFVMNKPKGYISALKDPRRPVVMEFFHQKVKGLHLVGRLDKDTTGLLVLTNDGAYTHRATHPKKHVDKVYLVSTKYQVEDDYKEIIEEGMQIDYGKIQLRPGKYEKVNQYQCRVTISEGKYHQVKKMFLTLGNEVEELHREKFGTLTLKDYDLKQGEYKEIDKPV